MALMDKELKEYSTTCSASFDEDHCNDVQKQFRTKNPIELNENELESILESNIQRSRQNELFLEPGPASIMLK